MGHYLIELAVWLLIAFFIGCLVGWFLRRIFGSSSRKPETEPVRATWRETETPPAPVTAPVAPVAQSEPVPEPVSRMAPAPIASAEPEEAVVPAPATPPAEVAAAAMPLTARMERPKGLSEARGGKPDNLQRISGIGPKNEKILHNLGVFHFDQIASWTAEQVSWVDDHLKFNGRIGREQWIEQARLLAEGKEDEFRTLFGTGGLKNRMGISESGSRTRKS